MFVSFLLAYCVQRKFVAEGQTALSTSSLVYFHTSSHAKRVYIVRLSSLGLFEISSTPFSVVLFSSSTEEKHVSGLPHFSRMVRANPWLQLKQHHVFFCFFSDGFGWLRSWFKRPWVFSGSFKLFSPSAAHGFGKSL